MASIHRRIHDARIAQELTQGELAKRAKTRQATVSLLEGGQTRRVDLDVLHRVCAVLDLVELSELFDMEKHHGGTRVPATKPERVPGRRRRGAKKR